GARRRGRADVLGRLRSRRRGHHPRAPAAAAARAGEAGSRNRKGLTFAMKYRRRAPRWIRYGLENNRARSTVRNDDGARLGRAVRRREIGARRGQRIPALDGPLRRRLAALARRARGRRGTPLAPAGRTRPAPVLARLARIRRLQPARLHRTRARTTAERLVDRRARAAAHGARPLAAHARTPLTP